MDAFRKTALRNLPNNVIILDANTLIICNTVFSTKTTVT
jgi:hypothetical protein